MADKLVVGRVVDLDGGRIGVAPFPGPKLPNGDRIAAMIVAARNWKAAKARHGLSSEQAQYAQKILLAAAESIE